jgi:5-methylcytosine-specific restriction endonuclease McrA
MKFQKGHKINVGKKQTEEHKIKRGLYNKKPNPFKGTIKKERIKKICSVCKKEFLVRACWAKRGTGKYCSYGCSKIGRNKGLSGERPTIMSTLEYKKWRREVFIRDNFTCVSCERMGGSLEAHHIKSFSNYPELRFEVNNGITLCESCHKIIHHKRRER